MPAVNPEKEFTKAAIDAYELELKNQPSQEQIDADEKRHMSRLLNGLGEHVDHFSHITVNSVPFTWDGTTFKLGNFPSDYPTLLIVGECPICHGETLTEVETLADVGRLIKTGPYAHHQCNED